MALPQYKVNIHSLKKKFGVTKTMSATRNYGVWTVADKYLTPDPRVGTETSRQMGKKMYDIIP